MTEPCDTLPLPGGFDWKAGRLAKRVLWRAQGGLCAICGKAMRWPLGWSSAAADFPSIEHVFPRWSWAHRGFGNITGAHQQCNGRKGDRLPTGCELIWLLAVNARLGVGPTKW